MLKTLGMVVMAMILSIAVVPLRASEVVAQASSLLPVMSPGVHTQMFRRPGERAMAYSVYIPANYSPSARIPLVLALHYGGNPTGAGRGVLEALVRPALADLGAIIVAPDSLGGPWDNPENERAVNALLDAVMASYSIDAKKVAVTGFSMGGAGTWHFAAKYPERFSAAIPVAGRPPASIAGWKLPVFAIHSRDDQIVPIGPTEARIGELRKNVRRAELVVLKGITHYETNRHVDGLRQAVPWLMEIWK